MTQTQTDGWDKTEWTDACGACSSICEYTCLELNSKDW